MSAFFSEEEQLSSALWEERLLAEVMVKRLRESPCPVIVISPHDIAPHLNGPTGERYWPLLLLAILGDAQELPSILSRVRSHYVGPVHVWGLSTEALALDIHITSSMLPLVISGEPDADDTNLVTLMPSSTLNNLPLTQVLSNLHSSAPASLDLKLMRVSAAPLSAAELEQLAPCQSWFCTAEKAEKERHDGATNTPPPKKSGESTRQYRSRMQREEVARGLQAHFQARIQLQRDVDGFWAEKERNKRMVRGQHRAADVSERRLANLSLGESRGFDDEEDDDAESSRTGATSDDGTSSRSIGTDATSIHEEADDEDDDKLLVGVMDQFLSPRSTTTDLIVAPSKRRCSSVSPNLGHSDLGIKTGNEIFLAVDEEETKSILSTSTCKAPPATPVEVFCRSGSCCRSSHSVEQDKRNSKLCWVVGLRAKFSARLRHKPQGLAVRTL